MWRASVSVRAGVEGGYSQAACLHRVNFVVAVQKFERSTWKTDIDCPKSARKLSTSTTTNSASRLTTWPHTSRAGVAMGWWRRIVCPRGADETYEAKSSIWAQTQP